MDRRGSQTGRQAVKTRAHELDLRVAEHDASKGRTTTSVVDDLLHNALDVSCAARGDKKNGD